MADFNDMWLFAKVVEHGGFSAAGRSLDMPKSKLSRRVSRLEEALGVRLLQRSTRHLHLTDIGQAYYRHCAAMVAEADEAQEVIDRIQSEPRGLVRLSCPFPLLQGRVGNVLSTFLARHPQVRLQIVATNRRVGIIDEAIDIALRVRPLPLEDSDLIVRKLTEHTQCLVASPALLDRLGRPETPADLARFDSLGLNRPTADHVWRLNDPDGKEITVHHAPRLTSDDVHLLRQAAIDGVGVVRLPEFTIAEDLAAGRLERVLPAYSFANWLLHMVFPSRRGLIPAVRELIDALTAEFKTGNPASP
ncbi:MAG: LysR substrate-binding domain-containing protein [Magnetospiraceae bacterium]